MIVRNQLISKLLLYSTFGCVFLCLPRVAFGQSTTYVETYSIDPEFGDNGTALVADSTNVYCIATSVVQIPQTSIESTLIKLDANGEVVYGTLLKEDSVRYKVRFQHPMLTKKDSLMVTTDYQQVGEYGNMSFVAINKADGSFRGTLVNRDTIADISASLWYSADSTFFYESSHEYDQETRGFPMRLRKLSLTGERFWERRFLDGIRNAFCLGFRVDAEDNVIFTHMQPEPLLTLHERPFLTKVAPDGTVLWSRAYPVSDQTGQRAISQVTNLNDGKIALGWTRDTFHPWGAVQESPPAVFILDASGTPEANYVFDGNLRFLSNLYTARNGDVLGVGSAVTDIGDTGWMFRLNDRAELIWERYIQDNRLGEEVYAELNAITEADDGAIVACGNIFIRSEPSDGGRRLRTLVVKLDADGCLEPGCSNDTIHLKRPVSVTDRPGVTPVDLVTLRPNPVTDEFRLEWSTQLLGGAPVKYVLYNVGGQVYREGELANSEEPVMVKDLPSGVYFVGVSQGTRQLATLRLIKR